MLNMVRSAGDHDSIGPTGEPDQSNARIRPAISLSPRKKHGSARFELLFCRTAAFELFFTVVVLGMGRLSAPLEFQRIPLWLAVLSAEFVGFLFELDHAKLAPDGDSIEASQFLGMSLKRSVGLQQRLF